MQKRRVAILYTHSLFGEGIAQLLRADREMDVTCLRADRLATADELVRLEPYAIVVEGCADDLSFQSLVRDMAPALFIRVDPDDNAMVIYYGRQVVSGRPETLREAIRSGPAPVAARAAKKQRAAASRAGSQSRTAHTVS